MKFCPSCGERYRDDWQFCELDGTQLAVVSAPVEGDAAARPRQRLTAVPPPSRREGLALAVGLSLGLLVCATAFAVYLVVSMRGDAPLTSASSQGGGVSAVQAQSHPSPARVSDEEAEEEPSPTPTPGESPSPLPPPSPAGPPRQTDDGLDALRGLPTTLSSAAEVSAGQLTLRLVDGTTIEAEDAWLAPEGVWYRRSGILTLIARNRVRSARRHAAPTPSATPG